MVVATNSTHVTHEVLVGVYTHTKVGVVHTNSIHGSGHKQYTCPSQSASQSGKQRLVLLYMKGAEKFGGEIVYDLFLQHGLFLRP